MQVTSIFLIIHPHSHHYFSKRANKTDQDHVFSINYRYPENIYNSMASEVAI